MEIAMEPIHKACVSADEEAPPPRARWSGSNTVTQGVEDANEEGSKVDLLGH